MERYGSYIHREAMWRYAFFALVAVNLLAAMITLNVLSKQQVIPYLVSTDSQGKTLGISRLEVQKSLPQEFIQSELAEFVQNWRTVTADFDLQTRMLEKLSGFTAGAAKGQLREWFEQNSPYELARSGKLIQIDIKGLPLSVSKDSWRVEWQETTRSHNGTTINVETYAATLSVMIVPPKNEAEILVNPGGVRVFQIDITKILR